MKEMGKNNQMPCISVVVPVFNSEESITPLYNRLVSVLRNLTDEYEIIFINDASLDNAWPVIKRLSEKDEYVKGINFSRNFGQHYAITAGLDVCCGEWVVVMDCDLQDNPAEIINFYNKAKEGFDIVLGQRQIRKDNMIKRLSSYLYYSMLSYLTDTKIDSSIGAFRILSRPVVDEFIRMREYYRFFGAMINWLGFKVAYIPVSHQVRHSGKTSYSFRKSVRLAINGILSFSDKPLKITIKIGILLVLLSSFFIGYKIIYALINHSTVLGWPSLIASVFFSTGLIVSILGLVGLYVGRIFEQVKQRPLYIIQDKTNL